MKRDGFTFIEVMIAVVIGAFIAVTAAAAMRGIASGNQLHQDMTALSDEMRYAVGLIRNDLACMYRNEDFHNAKFRLSRIEMDKSGSVQSLIFYMTSHKKARSQHPEGDVYEVEYFVTSDPESTQSHLMRRYCPVVPGVEVPTEVQTAGILGPVAESIQMMQVRCYDGTQWRDEWNEKNGQFPELVEVVLLAAHKEGGKVLTRSIIFHPHRLKKPQNASEQSEQDDSLEQDDYNSYMSDGFSDIGDQEAQQ